MNRKLVVALLLGLITLSSLSFGQKKRRHKGKVVADNIEWISLPELEKRMKKQPRKIIFDFYTSWCGWCKVMDKKTYSNKELAAYVNKNYYAVKVDAETKEPISFMGKTYEFKPEYKANQFAIELLNGQMSYPTTVIAGPNMSFINPIPGYQRIDQMEMLLKFFVEVKTPSQETWNDFSKNFKASWTPGPEAQ